MREAALHTMGHLPNLRWHYWQDQKQLWENQTISLPAPCHHLRIWKDFVDTQMGPAVACKYKTLWMKLYFNEIHLVFLQQDSFRRTDFAPAIRAHPAPTTILQGPQKQCLRDKEKEKGTKAWGQVSNQSSASLLVDLCGNSQNTYPFEMGQRNRRANGVWPVARRVPWKDEFSRELNPF